MVMTSARLSAAVLLDIELDERSGEAGYRQLVRQLRSRIDSGRLPPGSRLPASRDLAGQLGIARNTVISAYDELIADGLLAGRGRHGTFVVARGRYDTQQARPHAPALLARLPQEDTADSAVPPHLDWRPGQANSRSLPLEAWRNACREAGRRLPPSDYGDPQGELSLRQAIVQWLAENRSLNTQASQIIITHGTGHALHLLAQALLQAGDVCAVENPGYQGAVSAFRRAGAGILPLGVDEEGLQVDALAALAQAPALLHVTPAHQYPGGWRLAGPRRRSLIDYAVRQGMLIVENEYDAEFHYAGTNYPPLYTSAPEHTVLLSTFAKAISPSLRFGFMVAPPAVSAQVAALIARERVHVSWPLQKIVESLLRSSELDRHLRRVRRHYAEIRNHIWQRLAGYAPRFTLAGSESGLHVVLNGQQPADVAALQALLQQAGVRCNSLQDFSETPLHHAGLLLGYGHMEQPTLDAALSVLEQALAQLAATTDGERGPSRR